MPGVTMTDDRIDPGGFDDQGDPTKVLVRRYLAYLVDFLVIILVAVLALSFTAESNTLDELSDTLGLEGDQRLQPDDVKRYQEDDGTYVFYFRDVPVLEDQVGVLTIEDKDLDKVILITIAAWILLYVGLQGFTGATVGKAAAGIRTVKKSGDPPGIVRALGRSIFLPIDALPSAPFLPLVGTISAVATKGNKRLGDLVGGTYVVDKDAAGAPIVFGPGAPVRPVQDLAPEADVIPQAVDPDPWAGAAAAGAAAPVGPAAAPDPNAPAWAQPAPVPGGNDVDWTSEQPSPVAGTDPWAPAAGAGTAASDWERVIAEEQAQADPGAAAGAAAAAATAGGADSGGSGASIDDYEPQWDEQRKSYIQWDPRRDEWLQFSDELQQWHPIDRPPTS
jgi:uncharacterized RDD family membrane protein YckC